MPRFFEYRDYYYEYSDEREDDNRKIFHYAVKVDTHQMTLLDFSPYTRMTQYYFKDLVDRLYESEEVDE